MKRSQGVNRFVQDDHSESLALVRTIYRDGRSPNTTTRWARMFGGASGFYANLLPFVHVWRLREGRFETIFLCALRDIFWRVSIDTGVGHVGARDLERTMLRWATTTPGYDDDEDMQDSSGVLGGAVSERLRRAYTWQLVLGFVPIIGAVAGYLIRAKDAERFQQIARSYCEVQAR